MTRRYPNTYIIIVIVLIVAAASTLGCHRRNPQVSAFNKRGGLRAVLRARTQELKNGKWSKSDLEVVRRVVAQRAHAIDTSDLNKLDSSDPNDIKFPESNIIVEQPDKIIVEMPGATDANDVVKRLQYSADLEFYWLRRLGNKGHTREALWTVREERNANTNMYQEMLVDTATGSNLTPEQLNEAVFSNPPLFTGKDLVPGSCEVLVQPNGDPEIAFEFSSTAGKAFENFTAAHTGEYLSVFLDKKLLTAPIIEGAIPGGKGVINGIFTLDSAKSLAANLNAGGLPMPLDVLQITTVKAGATKSSH